MTTAGGDGTHRPGSGGVVAITDPYSTGRFLASYLAARELTAVAVVPEHPVPIQNAGSLVPQAYRAVLTYRGDPEETVAELRSLGTTAVIAGCETGVVLADQLGAGLAALGVPGVMYNDPASSHHRRDKGYMADALRRAGLRYTPTLRVRSLPEAFAAAQLIAYPVVVKPPGSSGTDSVRICADPGEVEEAWRSIAGRADQLGQVNDVALVQRYLVGQQYVVNTVSVPGPDGGGAHYVHEVWEDHRAVVAGRYTVFDRMSLLPADDTAARAAGEYMCHVLSAVGLTFGPAHSEVIRTSDGFVLIEVNPRLAGMIDPTASDRATGQNQVSLTAELLAEPAGFADRHCGEYQRLDHAVQLWLASPRSGVIDPEVLGKLLSLPTAYSTVGHVEPGGSVRETVDLASSPGFFYLIGEKEKVERDAAMIRGAERDGLYK
jgi:biotin carboxylase